VSCTLLRGGFYTMALLLKWVGGHTDTLASLAGINSPPIGLDSRQREPCESIQHRGALSRRRGRFRQRRNHKLLGSWAGLAGKNLPRCSRSHFEQRGKVGKLAGRIAAAHPLADVLSPKYRTHGV